MLRLRLNIFTAIIAIVFIAGMSKPSHAEYRAYLIEVYDWVDRVTWEVHTGMPPDQYLYYHGGPERIRLLMKATWMCWGVTGNYEYVCDLPTPRFPKFRIGDRVTITLEKHMTMDMTGTVEVALWREDLASNVYGVRFDTPNKLYARYFEHDLKSGGPPEKIYPQDPGPPRPLNP